MDQSQVDVWGKVASALITVVGGGITYGLRMLHSIDAKVDAVDDKIEAVDDKVTAQNSRLGKLETKHDLHEEHDNERFTRIDDALDKHDQRLFAAFGSKHE